MKNIVERDVFVSSLEHRSYTDTRGIWTVHLRLLGLGRDYEEGYDVAFRNLKPDEQENLRRLVETPGARCRLTISTDALTIQDEIADLKKRVAELESMVSP